MVKYPYFCGVYIVKMHLEDGHPLAVQPSLRTSFTAAEKISIPSASSSFVIVRGGMNRTT